MPKIYSRNRIKVPNLIINIKNNKKIIFIAIFILVILITVRIVLKAVNPIFETLCEDKAKSIATLISNEQATIVMGEHSYDELFTIEKDANGNITMIKSNVIPINEIISDVAIKIQEEIKIRPTPDMPKIDLDKTISSSEEMQNLVESINNDNSLNNQDLDLNQNNNEEIRVVSTELSGIKTNSKDKVVIPEKIDDIKVKLQKTINAQAQKTQTTEEVKKEAVVDKAKNNNFAKGTWYTQIIASSSRQAVQSLWNNLSSRHSFIKKYPYEIEEIKTAQGTILYRLKVGSFKNREEAVELSNLLKKKQISSIIKQN